jgi:hypothetical protein
MRKEGSLLEAMFGSQRAGRVAVDHFLGQINWLWVDRHPTNLARLVRVKVVELQ